MCVGNPKTGFPFFHPVLMLVMYSRACSARETSSCARARFAGEVLAPVFFWWFLSDLKNGEDFGLWGPRERANELWDLSKHWCCLCRLAKVNIVGWTATFMLSTEKQNQNFLRSSLSNRQKWKKKCPFDQYSRIFSWSRRHFHCCRNWRILKKTWAGNLRNKSTSHSTFESCLAFVQQETGQGLTKSDHATPAEVLCARQSRSDAAFWCAIRQVFQVWLRQSSPRAQSSLAED